MTVEMRPYWQRKTSEAVMERLRFIAELTASTERTVRNITYKLYPDLHGKALDRAYNTTIKDVVRGRIMGLVPWKNIRESRVRWRSPDGFASKEAFLKSLLDKDFWRGHSLSKRPSHRRPLEVWFEKDTVEPEFGSICRKYSIPYLSTRGQLTWTAKKNSSRLTAEHLILYFGDRDEKGVEIRDVIERDLRYLGIPCEMKWCAVTEEQEERFDLPSGARLDGFDLRDLPTVIEEAVSEWIDGDRYEAIKRQEAAERRELRRGRLVLQTED
ncbi:MAG: hypothetical protein LN413_03850 [Candidatus Thermoplasmatota archaeon]|nr:hypothetical protein [Candidatus Thermoplasmatota archaeon]